MRGRKPPLSLSKGYSMRSTQEHLFAQVPSADIPRSAFDRSHGHKTTFNSGYLIPVFIDEALPGDTFNLRMSAFCRMATPIYPIMDNIYLDSFFFFVPYRLLWANWERFNGAQTNPGDSTDYLIPKVVANNYSEGSIFDYMGLPTKVTGYEHSALPLRAYALVYNEWFRDENLQNSFAANTDDGPDLPADFALKRRGKRHDYFTSCLPWPQKGPTVTLPLGTSAPVSLTSSFPAPAPYLKVASTGANALSVNPVRSDSSGRLVGADGSTQLVIDPRTSLFADLTTATAATINQLRQAFQVQRLYERDARGGTRYTEIIRSHFGVVSPDRRLQRPEYLGGGSTPVNIHPVAQTSASNTQPTPQGNLSAFATAAVHNHGFVKSFTEHGTVIGIVSVRADLSYQQGLNRMWSRRTRFDFYWPALSHLGEQAVLNKEIYCVGSANSAQDAAAFGYQEAWAEYRYKPSQISGIFRSNATSSLHAWHLAQNYASLPVLNDSFMQENPPIDRVIAVPSQPQFLFDSFFSLRCVRPMPIYSVPGMIDHF